MRAHCGLRMAADRPVSEAAPSADDRAVIEGFADILWMERGLSRNTLSAYQSDLRAFAVWVDRERGRCLIAVQRLDLLDYLALLSVQGRKPRSSARLLSCLRQFYQHLLRLGLIQEDPSARVDAPKLGRPLPKSLTEAEVEALLAAPDTEDPRGHRDRTMLEVLYASGLRVTELVTLTPQSSQPDTRGGPGPGQGEQGAAGAPGGGRGELAPGLRGRGTPGTPRRPAQRLSLSHLPQRLHDPPGLLAAHQALCAPGGGC